jgi:hypothetical protein
MNGRPTTSIHPGVSWAAAKSSWKATIKVDLKEVYFGYFAKEMDAKAMYDKVLPTVKQLRSEGKDSAAIIAAIHAATPHVKHLPA